jgi:hypothetical protein
MNHKGHEGAKKEIEPCLEQRLSNLASWNGTIASFDGSPGKKQIPRLRPE